MSRWSYTLHIITIAALIYLFVSFSELVKTVDIMQHTDRELIATTDITNGNIASLIRVTQRLMDAFSR